jgi:hypothetical protein
MHKANAVCLILHCVCEKGNLFGCKMSMGARRYRGHGQHCDRNAMGGRAWQTNRESP